MPKQAIHTLFAIALAVLFASNVQADGYVRAEGTAIVDADGEPLLLRGMGLGGWMLQEGYMLGLGNLGQQHVIREHIRALIGEEKTENFYRAWRANQVREEDIRAMAAWGYNSVRLPMHFNLFTLPVEQEPVPGQNTWLETGFALTDQLLAWCKKYNLYLILDLHAAPGGQGNDFAISDRNPELPSLWDSPANRAKTVALWRKLAARYKNEPAIAAYDLINEPNWGFAGTDDPHGCAEKGNEPLRTLMMEITAAIREVDREHMLIIEGNCWGNNYAGVMPPWDDNLVVSFHKYWNDNNRESIASMLALRDQYRVPLWLGESGENSNAWFADAIELVESEEIGWAFWPLKKIGFNNPLEVHPNPGFQDLVNYWKGEGPRPTAEAAYAALMQLAEVDIRYEHAEVHRDVVDAMLRQPGDRSPRAYRPHSVDREAGGVIAAVDYDLGRPGIAYLDHDTANYHVSTGGERTPWNRGRRYRNDGVDIGAGASGSNLVELDSGEWLRYTLEVQHAGSYVLEALLDETGSPLALEFWLNDGDPAPLAEQSPSRHSAVVHLAAGPQTLVVRAAAGSARLGTLQLVPAAPGGSGG
ncbi:cellulase family glycosylhydrolase [Microbulbifer sp. CAU 1566]|uniref:cellulase family glycosylhydrolase n=1 Tax=Microbulbifer sp. CAU 1566 TaxID=2933269 RepID=UPI00200470AB|nr:cellulase family glycosylhydrolase [Microbulbifer sp. CAU 1566]MCK7599070.1 cellulase family glycosylhydrolase [Microbulbifer sp. CAU 1566]